MKQARSKLKSFNKTEIMKILLKNESIYRAEIARMAGLSIPTVMKITDEFIKNGLVTEIGRGASNGGKPPEMLQLIPNARFFLGVDLRGMEYRCAVINLHGDILLKHCTAAIDASKPENRGEKKIIEVLQELIEQTINRAGVDRSRVVGVGIGVPHPVDVKTGCIIYAKEMDWNDFDIVTPLEKALKIPVMVENTAKVIALAEKWFGEAAGEKNFSVMTVGHGIGSAILIDNEIYSGANLMSGEIGHTVIDVNGPVCRCGNRGCLEALASVTALNHYVQNALKNGTSSMLASSPKLDTKAIVQAARLGDPLAVTALERMANYLAIGIVNLINLLDLNLVMVTGGIVELYPELCSQVNQKVNDLRGTYFGKRTVSVKPLLVGSDIAMVGAATLLVKRVVDGGGTLD